MTADEKLSMLVHNRIKYFNTYLMQEIAAANLVAFATRIFSLEHSDDTPEPL